MSSSFLRGEKNSTLSSLAPPHEASQSGYSGGRGIIDRALSPNHGGAGETDLRDRSVAVDNSSEKAHSAERVESTPVKIKLIRGSYEKSNSSVIEVFSSGL